ncbi:sulfatase-like hydrolase/transferase [Verrucomicrobiaceae bacterium 227]
MKRELLIWALAALAQAGEKPNIVFIMADDLGYGDIGCFGSEHIQTPHLDALAKGGVKCTDFHSNGAVCSPTRAALMTGRYQQRSGITGVVTAANHRETGLAYEEVTLAEVLKEQGYRTGLFGKWHLGYPAKYNPVHHGFDEYTGFVSGNVDYHRKIDQEGFADWWHQDQPAIEEGYVTDLISDKGVEFVRKNFEKPFCLILTHGAPHYPLQGRKSPGFRVVGKPQPGQKVEDPKGVHAEMIAVMDEGIGKLVATLEELKIRKNTLVIFCSDNGPASEGSAGGLRGQKGQIYEGGHRVPAIFNWPGTLEPSVSGETMLTMDLLPTFLTMAGGEPGPALDGRDLLPLLKGGTQKREPVYWGVNRDTAVREGAWKLILGTKKKVQLFNLEQDLAEKKDVSAEHPEVTQRLRDLAEKWRAEMAKIPKKS